MEAAGIIMKNANDRWRFYLYPGCAFGQETLEHIVKKLKSLNDEQKNSIGRSRKSDRLSTK